MPTTTAASSLPPDATALRGRLRRPPSLFRRAKERAIEVLLAICGFSSVVAVALIFLFVFKEGIVAFKMAPLGDFIVSTIQESAFDPETEEITYTEKRAFSWQPNGEVPKVSFAPLLWGSLQVALLASALASVVGIACGIYLSEIATRQRRDHLKPAIELLVGIPTVVVGFFMLAVLARPLKSFMDFLFAGSAGGNPIYPDTLNAFVGALGVAVVIVPVIASLVDDALQAVPGELRAASFGLGATRWQTIWRVVLPAAFSGVTAATLLGFGRALGETMIVVMCAGNAAQIEPNPFRSATTMTARIAAEMGAAQVGSLHQHTLFLVGGVLVSCTFVLNLIAQKIIHRYRRRLQG